MNSERKEFIFEFVTGLYVLAIVLVFWKTPLWTAFFLTAGLFGQFWFWRTRADLAMMIAAALLGAPSEMICVKYGLWSYHAPGLFLGIPVWIPLIWAYLFCLFRRLAISINAVIHRLFPGNKSFLEKILFSFLGALIIIYYAITVLLINRKIAVVFTLFMIPAVIFWRGRREVLIFIIGGVLGTLGEYISMRLGFWHYHYPYFKSIGLPLSLPLAWGLSAVIIERIARIWESKRL